jgi:hypothetical protein
LAGSALAHGVAVGRARLVEEEGQAGDDGADRDPEPKEIDLSVPGHDLAEEHHREDLDDQTDELALQVTRRREPGSDTPAMACW